MSNRSYLVPRPPAFDHEHPRPKEEGEVLYCGNCQKWYVSWFPLTEVKTIWGRRPEWWIRIFQPQTIRDDYPANTKGNEMKMKKTLMDMIIKWHQAGYSLDEIAPLMPQVPKEEIKAIIRQHHE